MGLVDTCRAQRIPTESFLSPIKDIPPHSPHILPTPSQLFPPPLSARDSQCGDTHSPPPRRENPQPREVIQRISAQEGNGMRNMDEVSAHETFFSHFSP